MKRRIFLSFSFIALTAIVLTSALIGVLMYRQLFDMMRQTVENEASLIVSGIDNSGESYLESLKNNPASPRITFVSIDGTVLFDNSENAAQMENHADRPEIIEAIRTGKGESVRLSETLGKQTFYYALRLKNGSVIRAANTISSVWASIFYNIPYMLVIIAAIFVLAVFLASRQTDKIIRPINALNLDDVESNEAYDEISPLLSRILKQRTQIDRQMAENREKQKEFDSVTGNLREGLVVLNLNANIISVNQSALDIFRAKNGDYTGKPVYTIYRSAALQNIVGKALKGQAGEEIISTENRFYQLLGNPVTDEGRIKGVILLVLDITEKHEAEGRRREFSANVSHELKTPLTAISGYAELLKNGLVKPADTAQFAERIYNEAARMTALLNDIMTLSRLDENQIDLPRERVDLLEIVQEVRDSLLSLPGDGRRAAENPAVIYKGGKHITINVSGESAVITGIRRILEEMIFNLCDNAVKYNKENGRIDISVSVDDGSAIVSVADSGIGIPKEDQDRVFERFYRVDKSHSKETGGTGLGLSIVKHGALIHKAKVELESAPNVGTTIRLIFPRLPS
ncbi:MAG: ATP-binding protein [Flexilinea sp.]